MANTTARKPQTNDVQRDETKTETQAAPALTKEQKILNFIEDSKSGEVDLVPFLRSLYPLVSYSEPAMYLHQGEAKRLRILLQTMKNEGKITMKDETYLKLGTGYYVEGDTKTRYHTIDTVKIVATK